jgi:hypothetical protein
MTTGGPIRSALRRFDNYAARPPSAWTKVIVLALAVLLPVALWEKRGAVVGVVAVVFGAGLLVATFAHNATRAWSRRHVALDASIVVPLTFLALAYGTALALWLCLLIALVAGVALVLVAVSRRGR